MIDTRTDAQKRIDARAEKVINLFRQTRANSTGSDYSVIKYVVERLKTDPYNSITETGAYLLLKRNGVIKGKS